MKHTLDPDVPRSWEALKRTFAYGNDARWRCPAGLALPETCSVSMSALDSARRRNSDRALRERVRQINEDKATRDAEMRAAKDRLTALIAKLS